MKDYYRILEIHPEAGPEVIRNAYRALVQKYHPDHYHSSDKTRMNLKLQEINEAYEVLGNEQQRMRYDQARKSAEASGKLASASKSRSVWVTIRNMLLWGLGTYIALRFLLRPLLVSPVFRILLLVIVVVIFYRMMRRPVPRP